MKLRSSGVLAHHYQQRKRKKVQYVLWCNLLQLAWNGPEYNGWIQDSTSCGHQQKPWVTINFCFSLPSHIPFFPPFSLPLPQGSDDEEEEIASTPPSSESGSDWVFGVYHQGRDASDHPPIDRGPQMHLELENTVPHPCIHWPSLLFVNTFL